MYYYDYYSCYILYSDACVNELTKSTKLCYTLQGLRITELHWWWKYRELKTSQAWRTWFLGCQRKSRTLLQGIATTLTRINKYYTIIIIIVWVYIIITIIYIIPWIKCPSKVAKRCQLCKNTFILYIRRCTSLIPLQNNKERYRHCCLIVQCWKRTV